MAQVSSEGGCEPNLIPLLDLVLQLVMFFIMVANFAAQQVTSDVMLPLATSARPPDPGETDVIYLNLNSEGKLMVTGREPLQTLSEVKYFLMSEYQTAKRAAEAAGMTEPKTVVIIRADKNADFKPVYEILRECKQAGFRKWQLRATVKNK
ncbi:MAG: biopolymer transporter ExbD [Planctomycetia bacterium]|nr:biopolymer transporter ExbD [Planctomycetia bacterium]